jgi:hypothetical protein
MNLVFSVVVRPPWTSSHGSTFACPPTRAVNADPASSSPTTVMNAAAAPRAVRLRNTLPAPPGIRTSRSIARIGTGASTLIRFTSPYTYRSSMTSPMISTLA